MAQVGAGAAGVGPQAAAIDDRRLGGIGGLVGVGIWITSGTARAKSKKKESAA